MDRTPPLSWSPWPIRYLGRGHSYIIIITKRSRRLHNNNVDGIVRPQRLHAPVSCYLSPNRRRYVCMHAWAEISRRRVLGNRSWMFTRPADTYLAIDSAVQDGRVSHVVRTIRSGCGRTGTDRIVWTGIDQSLETVLVQCTRQAGILRLKLEALSWNRITCTSRRSCTNDRRATMSMAIHLCTTASGDIYLPVDDCLPGLAAVHSLLHIASIIIALCDIFKHVRYDHTRHIFTAAEAPSANMARFDKRTRCRSFHGNTHQIL